MEIKERKIMKAPDKIYVSIDTPIEKRRIPKFVGLAWTEEDNSYEQVEYIRKDVVDETIKSAEDHAYFAGQEKLREKLLEWVKNKITEADIAMDTADDSAIWGQRNAFKQVLDKLNSM